MTASLRFVRRRSWRGHVDLSSPVAIVSASSLAHPSKLSGAYRPRTSGSSVCRCRTASSTTSISFLRRLPLLDGEVPCVELNLTVPAREFAAVLSTCCGSRGCCVVLSRQRFHDMATPPTVALVRNLRTAGRPAHCAALDGALMLSLGMLLAFARPGERMRGCLRCRHRPAARRRSFIDEAVETLRVWHRSTLLFLSCSICCGRTWNSLLK